MNDLRFEGSLKTWTDDRGFGFIEPRQGGDEVFVHISAFPRDGQRPKIGEPLSFEIELNHEGKKRAIRVQWRGHSAMAPSRLNRPRERVSSATRSPFQVIVLLVVLLGMGVYGYNAYSKHQMRMSLQQQPMSSGHNVDAPIPATAPAAPTFGCDGRRHCSQMTSCAEAKYFINHCPGTMMDGDNDGIPCEQDLCTGLLGN